MTSATLLLEIGCEELPTAFLDAALDQVARIAPEELSRARISHGALRALGTARRITVLVGEVALAQSALDEEILGPPESAGKHAADGFARKNSVSPDALSLVDTPKGRYFKASRRHPGGPSREALPGVLLAICKRITFAKSMRWAAREETFGRPIQWLVALHGESVVNLDFAGHRAGRSSRGHRFLFPEDFTLARADDYLEALRARGVDVDPRERREALLSGLHAAARSVGGTLSPDGFLEREVLGLVERPHALVGRFDPEFLALPHPLIESVMRGHQRYFAVRGENNQLLPVFLTVANTALDPETIRRGNERVMRARLSDARFFIEQDKKSPLGSRAKALEGVAFHPRLGTYGDKLRRITRLAVRMSKNFGVSESDAELAASLSKLDLVTLSVGEFPELQGVIGSFLAAHESVPSGVCASIAEHYQPRGAADGVAPSKLGALVSVADRVDTLVGCLAAGLKPSGSEDPFGLRRVTLGFLRTLLHHGVHVSLSELVGIGYEGYQDPEVTRWAKHTKPLETDVFALKSALLDFASERLRGVLEESYARDMVSACMAAGREDPVDVHTRVSAIAGFWATPAAADLSVAFRRVFNISRESPSGEPDAGLLTLPAEIALLTAFAETRGRLSGLVASGSFGEALELVAKAWRAPVDRLFTEVFVMDKDPALRDARLRLLGRMADAVGVIARFDAIEESKGP